MIKVWITAIVFFFASMTPSHAMDKKLKMMLKTSGYGAAAGLGAGAAAWAIGLGGPRTAFIGTSLGLYAGIALGVYVLATANYDLPKRKNPLGPRRPVGPDDWENENPENYENMVPPEESRIDSLKDVKLSKSEELRFLELEKSRVQSQREVALWMPLLTLNW